MPAEPAVVLRGTVSSEGALLADESLSVLVPAGLFGPDGGELEVLPAGDDGLPAAVGGLQTGDRALEIRLTDTASGVPLSSLTPPLTLTYTPSQSELAQAGDDLGRMSLAEATDAGWQPLLCSRAGGSLICSLAQPGTVIALSAPPAVEPLDFDLLDGRFYKQGNGFSGGGELGYSVIDDAAAPLWSEFERLGGVEEFGNPITRRFVYQGFVTQVFQNGALQWRPDLEQATEVNTLNDLSALGYDRWLDADLQIPAIPDWSSEQDLSPDDVLARRLELLAAYPDLRDGLEEAGLVEMYGLPTAAKQYESMLVVRFERATLQVWTADTSLAPAGTTIPASGAQLGKQVGLWPGEVMAPELAPVVGQTITDS
jgi:hypothetical protein